jgi:hypothetical protein
MQLKDHTNDAIVVTLNLSFQALATLKGQDFNRFHNRRSLIPHVARGRMLETRLLKLSCPEDLLQLIEADFFAYVELDENQNRTVERRI